MTKKKPEPRASKPLVAHRDTPAPSTRTKDTLDRAKSVRTGAVPPPPDDVETGLRVSATKMGFYGNKRRRPGDIFDLADRSHFSTRWMRWTDSNAKRHTTSTDEALAREHELMKGRAADNAIVTEADPDIVI